MRLVTRGDLDGLTCSVLITSMERIERIELIHPQQLTDGEFEVLSGDILANLPYHPKCSLWFDHHELTDSNKIPEGEFAGNYGIAPSTARLVHDYYVKRRGPAVFARYAELLDGTDRVDSANLTRDDVVNPQRVILLGFTIDSRTGLKEFRDYFLFLGMALRSMSIDEVLSSAPVVERVEKMRAQEAKFKEALLAHSWVDANVVVTDFRGLPEIPVGNRFLVYTLFPDATVSVRLQWGPGRKKVMATCGHNIFERSSWSDIGHTMALFGGGGHRGAGSCPLPAEGTEEALKRLLSELKRQG
ncbi:MAG: exopolyphosphatase [Thermoanaerobaculia bacterium]|nr:exopolyphosphatase [Thermoanaerobaculia bacterium]